MAITIQVLLWYAVQDIFEDYSSNHAKRRGLTPFRENAQLGQLAYLRYIHLIRILISYLGYIYPN